MTDRPGPELSRHEELYRLRYDGLRLSAAELCRRRRCELPRARMTELSEAELRRLHRELSTAEGAAATDPGVTEPESDAATLLDLKAELAERLLGPCRLCHLRCDVDRRLGERGDCLLGPELTVYRDFVHLGEEPEVRPSHAVFLSGCNFRCLFCSDWDPVVRPSATPRLTAGELAERIDRRRPAARTLSFVGGDPDMQLPGVLRALQRVSAPLRPLVWNSNMSQTPESFEVLDGLVDLWLAGLKFGADDCARRLAGVEDYGSLCLPNIRRAADSAALVVRHLIMPGHHDCCTVPALTALAEAVPGARLNILDQFEPTPVSGRHPAIPELAHRAPGEDAAAAARLARELGLRLTPFAGAGEEPRQALDLDGELDSAITIRADGSVVVENLTAALLPLRDALEGGDDRQSSAESGQTK